jgi:CBS domain-containing membrane protein
MRGMVRVRDVMSSPVRTIGLRASLATAFDAMAEASIRHLPVVDDQGRLRGLITERDLFRHALADTSLENQRAYLENLRVEDVMATRPCTVGPESELRDAGRTMLTMKYGCLPVVENHLVVGILTEADFVRLAM